MWSGGVPQPPEQRKGPAASGCCHTRVAQVPRRRVLQRLLSHTRVEPASGWLSLQGLGTTQGRLLEEASAVVLATHGR
jgi:hypothetical protein